MQALKNLSKVKEINPDNYRVESSPNGHWYKPYIKNNWEENIKVKPVQCDFFGCGKTLSALEKLCANKCLKHQGNHFNSMSAISI